MKNKKVLLGMSGGVDSSVSAILLKKKGFKVIGAFMKNFSDAKNPLTGECNYIEERKMAQKVSAILEIPFITLDFEKEYKKQVLDPMFEAYKKGITPNPDVTCNTKIKFPLLWREAKSLGCDSIATGHYARIKKTRSGFSLSQGKDKTKDQSYFLSELTQEDLSHTIFPVGNLTKKEVRKIAEKNKLPNYNKKGTSGICFVGKVDMKKFLEKKIKNKKGKILTPEGEEIGIHPGIMYYTIGQKIGVRSGIEIKNKKYSQQKLYVAEKKKKNELIVAPENHPALKRKSFNIKKLKIINPKEKMPQKLKVRIRHLGELHSGKLISENKIYKFILKKPLEGIADGQEAVFYKGKKLISAGEITF